MKITFNRYKDLILKLYGSCHEIKKDQNKNNLLEELKNSTKITKEGHFIFFSGGDEQNAFICVTFSSCYKKFATILTVHRDVYTLNFMKGNE